MRAVPPAGSREVRWRQFAAPVCVLALVSLLSLPVSGQAHPAQARPPSTQRGSGTLAGVVTDAQGHPQEGAIVEVRGEGLHRAALHSVTSDNGSFQVAGLVPGVYYVEVGKGSRVAARQRVEVHASERALLLVSLPQILDAIQFGPPPGQPADHSFDWALRQSTVWRPVLRLDDSGWQESAPAEPVTGYVALTAGAGSSAFESPDLATEFRVDSGVWGMHLSVLGAVGTNGQGGGSDTRLQASFSSNDPSRQDRLVVAVRQVAVPGLPALPSLRVVSLNYANALNVGDRVRIQYGSMLNAATMTNTVATLDPYLRATYRVSDHSQIEYRAASAVPPLRFNRDYAEMPDPTPQVTLAHGRTQLERAHHQEVLYSDSLTPNDTLSAAVFNEHFRRAAVNGTYALNGNDGVSPASASANDLLPDLLNNMFIADGGSYGGWGYRVNYERRLGVDWRADLGYSDGVVLAPAEAGFVRDLGTALSGARAHAWTVKLSGITPLTHTSVICSYRTLSRPAATGLDLYDDSPGRSDSYANLYVRQPLPSALGGEGRIEALVEIRNLLAQGYIPMFDSEGNTLYLVQSARSLRGGFTIRF